MPFAHSTDQAIRAVARLLQQYKDATSAGVKEVVEALAFEVQDLEDALWSILEDATLARAIGFNLERLGALVGEPRNGLSDEPYWTRIAARIRVNHSSGTIEDLIAVAVLLAQGATVQVIEYFPAAVSIKVNGVAIASPDQIASMLKSAKKAGVRLVVEYSTAPSGSGFVFAGGTGLGFPDALLTSGSGGKLAGVT